MAEIHRELVQIYGNNCIDVSNVRRWKRDFENNEDELHYGWPADSWTADNICCTREILQADNCFTLDEIVALMLPVGCGWSTTHTIIHEVLQLQKLNF